MHVQHLKRYGGRYWRAFSYLAPAALLLQVVLLIAGARLAWGADGDGQTGNLPRVLVVEASASGSFAAQRGYAGAVIASRTSVLGFKFAGQIARMHADIGDRVAAGALLAELDSASSRAARSQAEAQVAVAKARVDSARANEELARQSERRFAELVESGHVSAQQFDEQRLTLEARSAELALAAASLKQAQAALRAAQVAVAETRIVAPYQGTIAQRLMDEGSQVNPGQPVLELVETTNKEAHVGLPEQLASGLEAEQVYELLWAQRVFEATLTSVLPVVDRANRTLTAVFALDAATSEQLPIGAVIELRLASTVSEAGFWVPLSALTESDRGLWGVYVVNGADQLERRLVEIVHAENNQAYVRGTLSNGDQIVATGVQRLVPGQRVVTTRGLAIGLES